MIALEESFREFMLTFNQLVFGFINKYLNKIVEIHYSKFLHIMLTEVENLNAIDSQVFINEPKESLVEVKHILSRSRNSNKMPLLLDALAIIPKAFKIPFSQLRKHTDHTR